MKEFLSYYDEYKHKIYTFFYYRLPNDTDLVEDLISETFLKAFEKFDTFNDRYAFSTWIYTIARNVLIDYFRKNKKVENIDDINEGRLSIIDKNADVLQEKIDVKIGVEQIKKILNTLPKLQKECILLRYLEDMEYKKIAEVTDKSQDNVRQAISRGLKKLKNYVESKK